MPHTSSDLNGSLRVASSGMTAQTKRLLVISQNLANVNTKSDIPGGEPYQRKTISFKAHKDLKTGLETVQVKDIGKDPSAFRSVYSPGDPAANAAGYVLLPNVNAITEAIDMRDAGNSHEANLKAYEKILKIIEETIGLLRH